MSSPDGIDLGDPYPPEPIVLARAQWDEERATRFLFLEQEETPAGPRFRVAEWFEHDLGPYPREGIWYRGADLRSAARTFGEAFEGLSVRPAVDASPGGLEDELLPPFAEERTLVRLDRGRLDELLAQLPEARPRSAPPIEPTWPTRRSEPPALSPQAAAVLQSMREQVRGASPYRSRILARHPAPVTEFDAPPSPEAARAAERIEARLAALEGPAPAGGAGPSEAPPAESVPAAPREVQPAVLERIGSVVYAHAAEAHTAEEALRARVRTIAPGAERTVAAALREPGAASGEQAALRARAALGERGFSAERDQVAELAASAWEARSRLDRLVDRAAEVLEMRRTGSTLAPEARVDAHEVLREVERRRAELARADLEHRAKNDRTVLPAGQPRMQEGGKFQDIRSIDCLRCGTTAGREDGRSRLRTDGTPKVDPDGRPDRFAPRDGEVCTPCWLNGAPMSIPELKLAQRQARLLEGTQVHYRPGQAGWDERAAEWLARERARRGLVAPLEERLDAPSPWVVQPSPAEVGDRRMEALIEREAQAAE
ncbi:MAG TPA: hypothetical protein VFR81_15140, partial [Longimicrobium sp.]|nr:hypothetical protein [Longimicrobium sp.]